MKYKFPIIGIGASAGGLEPLELFFENVQSDSNLAYVVIQHLAPNHKSLMDELLARHTNLPIRVIENGLIIKPNYIYLNPPKKFVELDGGRFALSEKEDRKLSFPISAFFESLAAQAHGNTCAIVISGTGSDGSEGIKFIKEKGGLVLAQDPSTAKFDGMPQNAIHTGCVDKICNIKEMPNEILKFFKSKEAISSDQVEIKNQESKIEHILSLVKNQTDVDFTGYKYSTIFRRTQRRLGILGFTNLDEYSEYMAKTQGEGHQLAKELLIGVTRFFRDENAFEALKMKVIPKLVENNENTKSIRIWVPACSTGEEAYSIAILLKDFLRTNRLQYDVTIFATDLDKEAIKLAANRVFPENIVNEIPQELLTNYFIPQRKGFSIAKEIREMIVFSAHNIIQDPPFSKIDLISCRNFLIYLNPEIQQRLFSLFQYTLNTNGYLFLGSSESLGDMADQFYELDSKHKIFVNINSKNTVQRIRSSKSQNTTLNSIERSIQNPPSGYENRFSVSSTKRLINEIQESLIQIYVPDTIVFSENFELLHTTGSVNQWLKLPVGEISTNVLKMLPESITIPFELMANKVLTKGKPVRISNIVPEGRMKDVYKDASAIDIQLNNLESLSGTRLLAATFVISDEKKGINKGEQLDLSVASKEKITILERELRFNKENLQTTIEELESSNEELQAANEELQSSNEELESVNEELYTVNTEYQEKTVELLESNNDLNNLIQSTDIAILFLDTNLQIRKFTPAIKSILNLMPQDIGRHISHFRGKFQLENFMEHIERVYEDLTPYEAALKDFNDKEYIMKIAPFKTQKKEIQGIVLSFIDISQYKEMQQQLSMSESSLEQISSKLDEQTELFELIANYSKDMISVLDLNGKIEYTTPSSFELTGFTAEDLLNTTILPNIPIDEHKTRWNEALYNLKHGQTSESIQYIFKTRKGAERWFETNFRIISDSNRKTAKILGNTRDIHQRILYQDEMEKLSLIAEQTSNAIIITDKNGKITFVNDAFERLTGYSESEVLDLKPGSFLQGPETDPKLVEEMSTAIKNVAPFKVEIINYTKRGTKYFIRIQAEPMYDANNSHVGFFSIQQDISREKDYEAQIIKLNEYLNQQNKKLEEVNKSLDEFAYVASHDLKAPVRNISGMISLLQKKGESITHEKKAQYFDVIKSASIEMNNLIDSLLNYSRNGTLNEDLKTINLKQTIHEVISLYDKDIQRYKAQVETQLEAEEIQVYPILFKRLLGNLLSNALKYRSKETPVITIKCYFINTTLKVEVSDNGLGIPKEYHESIFNIFKSLKKRDDSNGIGLSVCKKIAELHKGSIWVESEPGKGSVFHIELNTN